MAVYNSVQRALVEATPSERVKGTYTEGRLRYAHGSIPGGTLSLADGDMIHLFDLPANAQPVLVVVRFGDFGAGVVLEVGTMSDPAAFLPATSVATAGGGVVPLPAAVNYNALTERTEVYAKLSGGNPADNQPLHVGILYAMP